MHGGDRRSRHQRAWWWPPTTRASKASGRGLGILRDEGIRGGHGAPARPLTPLASSTSRSARWRRPAGRYVLFKSAMTLDGKVATSHRRLAVDLRRAEPRHARTAGAPSATPWRWASAPRWRTTRCSRRASRAWPGSRARVVFDSEARLPARAQLVRTAREVPLDRRLLARRVARRRRRRSRPPGREVIVAPGENEAARVPLGARPSSARATSSRCCSRAARTWRARSSTPARSTRCALFVAPMLRRRHASARGALEGQGVEMIDDARARAHIEVEQGRRRRADRARA